MPHQSCSSLKFGLPLTLFSMLYIVNMRTAKTVSITLPPDLLVKAQKLPFGAPH